MFIWCEVCYSMLFVIDCVLPTVMDVWYGGIVVWGMLMCLLQMETMASTDKLAQASWSHLGEINRGSPKLFSTNGRPDDPLHFWASERLAWARTRARPLYWKSSSHLGEVSSPERGSSSPGQDPSAWARSWARRWLALMFSLISMLTICLYGYYL